jgi:hypothetical protein
MCTIANWIHAALACCHPEARGGQRNRRWSFRFTLLTMLPYVALVHGPAIAEEPERPAPLVWFSPLAPAIWSDGPAGVEDYMKLFTPSAPWSEAASGRVQLCAWAGLPRLS